MFRPLPNGPYQPPYQSPGQGPTSWYPASGVGPQHNQNRMPSPSSNSQRAGSPGNSSSNSRPPSPSYGHFSMTGSANTLLALRGKSGEELGQLLSDKEAYDKFLHSLEDVKHFDTLRSDLRKSNINLARHNLTKDAQIAELKNQCTIIRTTELAAAQEKFDESRRREREIIAVFSPSSLLDKLHEAAREADEESERLHQQFLARQIDVTEFIQKYKQQRILYHKRTLTRLAGLTSSMPG